MVDSKEVQLFLDNIGLETFTVIFMTKGNEQRMYTGNLVPTNKGRSNNVPIQVGEGQFKQFSIDRVLSIQKG